MVMSYLIADRGLGMRIRTRSYCKDSHQGRKDKKLKADFLWIIPHFWSLVSKVTLLLFVVGLKDLLLQALQFYFASVTLTGL